MSHLIKRARQITVVERLELSDASVGGNDPLDGYDYRAVDSGDTADTIVSIGL